MPIDFERKVHCLLGLPFDAVDTAAALQRIRRAAAGGNACFFSTPNLNFLVTCLDDAAFRDSIIHSDLSVADGMPLVWMARLLGIPLRERVAGSGLFEALRADASRPLSVYLFGAPPGVAEQACLRLNAKAQGLRCVGFECPGFGSVEDMSTDAIIGRINASGADFLVVSLGARKGQAWIERNRARIVVPVISHLGAVVNFVAGTVSRAPPWMQRTGLEWLWRIKEEPDLWRRYFGDGLALLRLLATRVLPYALYLKRHRPAPGSKSDAEIEVSQHDGTPVLRLHGAWGNDQLDPLRREFTAAVATGGEVRLDMERVSYIDSAFVGLVLLLHGGLSQSGLRLIVVATSPAVRRVFRFCCAEFVLDAGSSPAKLMDRLVHQHT
ncbi:MAG: N-acetylglucosaminyldiphosphoundecaprenol [Rhodocyclaceae bacterium]|nr:MAG: N-acetylglucosaminyldiphosphoundecaprenol [Rhodocyclaceae bacterium]TNC98410.1 MAG: N-acetylglucosaminyldiphosphoundecaprenol [Rhodocyclaceae bacterium]